MTERQFIDMLHARVKEAGTMKQLAADLEMSATYLSDIISRRAEPGPKVLAALGLRRQSIYQPIRGDE